MNDDLGNRFDALKLRLGYIKQTDMLNDICNFFEVNAINLKQENFKSSFKNLTDLINTRFSGLQSRITVDLQSLNRFSNELTSFNSVYNEIVLKNKIGINDKSIDDNELIKVKNILEIRDNQINLFQKDLEDYKLKIDDYHNRLRELNFKMKVEKTEQGKKAYIDLPIEEIEKLFNIIEN
ncbi:hypothetical protein [Flavobacterium sp.]|uniref:hypothetical protein n=1 Tax=Flavobacterium sp. TaxID=239 RepID=UPI00375102BE